MSKSKKSSSTGAAKKPGKKTPSKPAEAAVLSEAEAPQQMPEEVVAPEPAEPLEVESAPPRASGKRGRKPKAAKEAAPKPYKAMSCLDAAAAVLKAQGEPMRVKDIIDAVFAQKLWHSEAPTPAATLASAILREMKKGDASRFKKTGRGLFDLNAK